LRELAGRLGSPPPGAHKKTDLGRRPGSAHNIGYSISTTPNAKAA